MKVIDLLNEISKGHIKHGTKFRIDFGNIYRDFYYDAYEPCSLFCLRCESDNSPLEDDIDFNDNIQMIITPKDRIQAEDRIQKAIEYIENEKEAYLKIKENCKRIGIEDYADGQLVACKKIEDILRGNDND